MSLLGQLTDLLTPRLLAIFIFVAGLVLLFSGATPAAAGRLALLHRLFPLGVIEFSHFTGSVVGALLLVLSHGIARKLDAAYFLAVAAIVVGIGASLLKGADYEEAVLLVLMLAVLWRARPTFCRRAAFFEARFSVSWVAAVIAGLVASVWLGLFAPLSGVDASPIAALWNRLGSFLYEHGESIYHFQGLRAYKDKFNPKWEPHYLAYPGGLKLPRVLADVAALVAGGYKKVFLK